jgi:hypothetical protein
MSFLPPPASAAWLHQDARSGFEVVYFQPADDGRYVRISGQDGLQRYDYTAPAFDFSCQLVYDEAGLVLTYPGIAVRAA